MSYLDRYQACNWGRCENLFCGNCDPYSEADESHFLHQIDEDGIMEPPNEHEDNLSDVEAEEDW